jgi:uncharacterized protein YjbI with pentapeptide repeats
VDLSGANLEEAILRGAKLSEVNLSKAKLGGTNLEEVYLSEIDLSKADLSRADLSLADTRQLNLADADLNRATLRGAKLRGADFSAARLCNATLEEANLSGANLCKADLNRAVLRGAHLTEATLRDSKLGKANLREADLTGADLRRADLRQANLDEARLCGANLCEAVLRQASLNETDLSAANLCLTDLVFADLSSAIIDRVQFNQTPAVSLPLFVAWPFSWIFRGVERINWMNVRVFGAIHLLTKASYVSLLVVPILAGGWPVVHAFFTAANQAGISGRHQPPDLPYSLAAAFFAALSVAFGHLLYEVYADPLLKRTTLAGFKREKWQDFNKSGPGQKRQLDLALLSIQEAARRRPSMRNANVVPVAGLFEWIPYRADQFRSVNGNDVVHVDEQILVTIEAGAEADYETMAFNNQQWAYFAISFYVIAVSLIVSIIWIQSISVLQQAGWI